MTLTYGSVCSGIEAASLAWGALGLKAAWFAEIEDFPSAVLAHHWPEVTNLGDMTQIATRILSGEIEAPAILVGGTPCQAFSIAGLRQGLDDPRGLLTLKFVELANAIDTVRAAAGLPPVIIIWENVPGVLTSHDNAFGNFIAALAGENEAFEPGDRPETGKNSQYWTWSKSAGQHVAKWTKHGFVTGGQRRLAWAVKDAQFYGVAQRRRRTFVISSARNDFDPGAVLFEPESVCRDTPPSREAGQDTAATAGCCAESGSIDSVICMAHGQGGAEVMDNNAPTLTCNHEAPIVTFPANMSATQFHAADGDVCQTIQAKNPTAVCYGFQPRIARNGRGDMGDCCHTLSAESGTTGRGDAAPCVAMAFAENNRNEVRFIDGDGQITAPIQCEGGKPGQGYQAIVEADSMAVRRLTPYECELLQGMPGDHTLIPTGKYKKLIDDELAYLRYHAPELPEDMLMKMAADGPRYKAIGNSMAVPVMRWIMERILLQVQPADHVEDFGNDKPPAPDVKPKAKKVKQKAEKVKLPPEYTRSPLKWAGGKYLLLKQLLNAMPPGVRLVEPFVGGGSVFLNAGLKNQFSRFLLADINADLVNLYQMLAIVPQQVVDAARVFYADFNSPEGYQTVKDSFNAQDMDAVTRAAAFLFINRHCFNGLIRYNQLGMFNVGYGKYEAPYFPESEIVDFIRVAPSCVFLNAGFTRTLALAGAGDVVYCDPPYEPMPGKDGFTGYAAGGFKWEDQEALAQACVDAHKRGAEVLITNSGAPKILELYKAHGMKVQDINAKRSISSKGSTRETATDILATLIHEQTE